MRSYEIQTFKDGKWRLDSIFDDRELAIFEAKKIDEGTRYAGVKVVEENWDEASNQTTVRTLFRGGAAKKDMPAKRRAAAKRMESGHRIRKGKEPSRKGKAKAQAKKSSFIVPILVLMVIILAAIGALIGLQYMSAIK